jgi:hypothetical protein
MSVEPVERLYGIKTVDIVAKRGRRFKADIIRGKPAQEQRGSFQEAALDLEPLVFNRVDPELSRKIVNRKFDLTEIDPENPEGTTIMWYRRFNAAIGDWMGYSIQQEVLIKTSFGTIPVTLWISRGFAEGYRGLGLGTFDIQYGNALHSRSKAIVHRTQSPASIYSVMKAFKEEDYYPWRNTYASSRLAREISNGAFYLVSEDGLNPPDHRGVAIADLTPNLAYVPDPDHTETMEIRRIMLEVDKVKLERGDAYYNTLLFTP